MKFAYALCIGILALAWSAPAAAKWAENGALFCSAANNQETVETVSDGSGGAIFVWRDSRAGNYDIYAQRVDANGIALWTINGVPICTAILEQSAPQLIPNGAGGAIITWYDYRSGSYCDVYAQKIDAGGAVQWAANGVALTTDINNQQFPQIVSDGSGGAIVTWSDGRPSGYDIYAQRIDANGSIMWTTDGVPICQAASSQVRSELVSDGAGGAIITWYDGRSGNNDIYVQKINASGTAAWTTDGVAICTLTSLQYDPRIVADGFGGAIITWYDYRSGTSDVYAQRISGAGTVQWTADGIAVCAATSNQMNPEIVSDDAGGAIIAWQDYRSANWDIYAQRISPVGAALWTANGIAVCTATGAQQNAKIASDAAGRSIVAWQDARSSTIDIYVQKIDASGAAVWAANGVSLCAATGDQTYPAVASDGSGGTITAWQDSRSGAFDVYAQRLEKNGYWGFPAPLIADVRDVPGDQGGFIDLAWYASRLDPNPDELIDRYTVWRGISHTGAELMAEAGAIVIGDIAKFDPAARAPVIRVEQRAEQTFFWKLMSTIDAYHLDAYEEVVPTLFDSTAVCSEYHYFQVIAHADGPGLYWISTPDSGYSIDNLSPAPPVGLAAEQRYLPTSLCLTWNANSEADLAGYAVYRGTSVDFVPGPSNLLASSADTACLDDTWSWDSGYYYKVSALDIHGNESGFALLAPDDVTGTETPKAPNATYLSQNYPNPFNPMTKVAFGLSKPGHMSLRIYDAAGHLVRTLLDHDLMAGRYELPWNGLDGGGRKMASGMYFYRLDAGTFTQTRKMILLR
jgi:hypothetical protein